MTASDAGVTVRAPRWIVVVVAVGVVVLVAGLARSGIAPSRELYVTTTSPQNLPDAGQPTVARHVETLRGVELLVVSKVTVKDCAALARDAGFEVPCLGNRSLAGVATQCAGDCVSGGGYLWGLRSIPSPPTSCRSCLPDIVVTAAPRTAPPSALAMTRCGSEAGAQAPSGVFYCDQAAGPANTQIHAGRTMRRGAHHGTVFAVSIGRRGAARHELVNAVFESLVFVAPGA